MDHTPGGALVASAHNQRAYRQHRIISPDSCHLSLGVHESSLPVAHPGYQVLSDILFRLGLIANALTQWSSLTVATWIDVAIIITCFWHGMNLLVLLCRKTVISSSSPFFAVFFALNPGGGTCVSSHITGKKYGHPSHTVQCTVTEKTTKVWQRLRCLHVLYEHAKR